MAFDSIISKRLVKSEDLNHHRTLFAGRCAEWFVESGFLAATSKLDPHYIVCLKIHGMEFLHPVYSGDILTFESMIVHTGRSTLTVYVKVSEYKHPELLFCNGFMTFVYVNENTVPRFHGLTIVPETEEEILLNQRAEDLKKQLQKK